MGQRVFGRRARKGRSSNYCNCSWEKDTLSIPIPAATLQKDITNSECSKHPHCITAVITCAVMMSGSRKGAALSVGQEEHNYRFTYTDTWVRGRPLARLQYIWVFICNKAMFLSCGSSDSMEIELQKNKRRKVVVLKKFFKKASCHLVMCRSKDACRGTRRQCRRQRWTRLCGQLGHPSHWQIATDLTEWGQRRIKIVFSPGPLFFQKSALTNNNALERHS